MRNALLILSLLTLAACGVDGAPKPPPQSPTQPGMTVEGKASVGIVGS